MNFRFYHFKKKNYDDYLRLYSPYFIDLEQIGKEKYRNEISKTGFMVGKPYELKEMSVAKIHLCSVKDGEVVGIIRGDNIVLEALEENEKLTWHCTSKIKNFYIKNKGIEIGVILVAADHTEEGVGTALLVQFLKHCKNKGVTNVFAWVVSSPKNIPSLTFHRKHGFKHVATFRSARAWGIPNYKSFLFYLSVS